jgi:hypothetical protein
MPPSASALFAPVFVLAFWTFAVLTWVATVRIRAGFCSQVGAGDFRLGESAKVPPHVALANRNYMNLLELPVLFYAVILILAVTQSASQATVALSWAYVALRIAHSLVHLTYNNVMHRLAVFGLSNGVLLVLWIMTALRVLPGR